MEALHIKCDDYSCGRMQRKSTHNDFVNSFGKLNSYAPVKKNNRGFKDIKTISSPSTKNNYSKSMDDVRIISNIDSMANLRMPYGGIIGSKWNGNVKSNNVNNIPTAKLQKHRSEANLLNTYPSTRYQEDSDRPHFVAVAALEDSQAIRCAEFHPNGRVYAVGSNSKILRICEYPSLSEVRRHHTTYETKVLSKRIKYHKGSIYCVNWAPEGEIVATGSNDKTIKLLRYNMGTKQLEGRDVELTMHDGTVRDLCFLESTMNRSSFLISGGAGDCKIYVTDCQTITPFQALTGHSDHVLSLYNWGAAVFVSGSQDRTVKMWDLRSKQCINTIMPATCARSQQGSPVHSVCVDPSGRLLVSGHEDCSCVLYDLRGNRPIQCFKSHAADVRSIRYSPSAYYLLTAGYDNKLILTDLQGDLTLPLPSVVVAFHTDKIITCRWHPTEFSFLSTSADKTSTLWALPPH